MTTAEDFEEAANLRSATLLPQQPNAIGGNRPQAKPVAHEKSPEEPGSTKPCELPRRLPMGVEGLEPPTNEL